MKDFVKFIWLIFAGILLAIIWQAYKYFRYGLADDVAESAMKEAKSFSLYDWFLSVFGFSVTNTVAQNGGQKTIWQWLDEHIKWNWTIGGNKANDVGDSQLSGKGIIV